MARLIFDIETNGLLPQLEKIHCIGIKDVDTGEAVAYGPGEIAEALDRLSKATMIIGHNILGFDIPAIQKLYPSWSPPKLIRDTLVLARLFWPHIKDNDFRKKDFPPKLIGSHSLRAWGHRLGEYKDNSPSFDEWSQELQDYMMQDLEVTAVLWGHCEKTAEIWEVSLTEEIAGKDCVSLEHDAARICLLVEEHGFAFDREKAATLVATLSKRQEDLEHELQALFPPEIEETIFVPKANNRKLGYEKGVPTTKRKVIPFNPGSRLQVGKRLQGLGWKPAEFTPDGRPKVDETVLSALPYPEAAKLSEYFTVAKRLGQVVNGKEAWLHRAVRSRIHGRIHSGGTHTGRMSHSSPNLAQVPAVRAPYGRECRECFVADEGHVLMDCDADGLELRTLAGYMAIFDKGKYIQTVLEGSKEDGTDMHSLNAAAIGCSRDDAKVFFYAMIYGAGDRKLGEILGGSTKRGKQARDRLMRALPALKKLIELCQSKTKKRGYLVGLDGRRLKPRSEAAALNTLLQSAGAVIMKRALVLFFDDLMPRNMTYGKDWAIVALVHDEICVTCKEEHADDIGAACVRAIREAGEYYGFRCELDGDFQVGPTWADVH